MKKIIFTLLLITSPLLSFAEETYNPADTNLGTKDGAGVDYYCTQCKILATHHGDMQGNAQAQPAEAPPVTETNSGSQDSKPTGN